MKKLLAILFIVTCCNNVFGQFAQLQIYPYFSENNEVFKLYLIHNTDTIYSKKVYATSSQHIEIDSLKPDLYKIEVHNSALQKDPFLIKYILLESNKTTIVNLSCSIDVKHYELDTITRKAIAYDKGEEQISLSFFDATWVDNSSVLRKNMAIDYSGYYWNPFNKHVGFLAGGGVELNRHYFSKDTTFLNGAILKKQNEWYSYFNPHLNLKLRISVNNQQELHPPSFLMDIGVGYYFPIAFRHVITYIDNKKFVNTRIHQFTDFRASVNLGFFGINVFCDYRLFDFLIGNYPELPRYNVGLRILSESFYK